MMQYWSCGCRSVSCCLHSPIVLRVTIEVDPVAEIERLGALKDKGLLTDEEFSAAKAKILGI